MLRLPGQEADVRRTDKTKMLAPRQTRQTLRTGSSFRAAAETAAVLTSPLMILRVVAKSTLHTGT